jgi:Putative translation initiation inhibitor, yjgF family
MLFSTIKTKETTTDISEFKTEDGVSEFHVLIQVAEVTLSFQEQLYAVCSSLNKLCNEELSNTTIAFRRFFLSDAANQAEHILKYLPENRNNISIIEQPPLNGTKIALWAYMLKSPDSLNPVQELCNSGLKGVRHGKYNHLWKCTSVNKNGDSESQMSAILNEYIGQLKDNNCTLSDNCIRTWIFVQNIDKNYAGIVKARKEIFAENGLTEKTHYIASTGINGRHIDKEALVIFDSYAIEGIQKEQIQYLFAKTHLSSTYKYGVTFERGTSVLYGDRRHIFISGTASINNEGEILHEGDIEKQTERMFENVEALLHEADCEFSDMAQIIIYLRDIADYQITRNIVEKQFPQTPKVIILAPVCRPGWLIEMECIAIREDRDNRFEPL